LEVDQDVLLIRAEAREANKEKKYHKHEIFASSFERSILLPEDVNDNDIRANLKDGLLNIVLPKSDQPIKSSFEISIR
jgi:HSP20 family protein